MQRLLRISRRRRPLVAAALVTAALTLAGAGAAASAAPLARDAGFGSGGTASAKGDFWPEQAVLLPARDGGVALASDAEGGALVRWGADGRLGPPPTGGDPWVELRDGFVDAATRPDGSTAILTETAEGYPDVAVLRPDGTYDPRWGGARGTRLPELTQAFGLAVDGRGRVAVIAAAGVSTQQAYVLRLREDGRPDRGFGDGGRMHLATGDGDAAIRALAGGGLLAAYGTATGVAIQRISASGRAQRRSRIALRGFPGRAGLRGRVWYHAGFAHTSAAAPVLIANACREATGDDDANCNGGLVRLTASGRPRGGRVELRGQALFEAAEPTAAGTVALVNRGHRPETARVLNISPRGRIQALSPVNTRGFKAVTTLARDAQRRLLIAGNSPRGTLLVRRFLP